MSVRKGLDMTSSRGGTGSFGYGRWRAMAIALVSLFVFMSVWIGSLRAASAVIYTRRPAARSTGHPAAPRVRGGRHATFSGTARSAPASPVMVRAFRSAPVIVRSYNPYYNPALYYGLRNPMNTYYGRARHGGGGSFNQVRRVVRRPDRPRSAAERMNEYARARRERMLRQMSHGHRRPIH